ncbi:hypothetical protein BJ508DRAFT_215182 [Ascobolus immersus RN42]|uniref:Pro-apoptotic serine protease NMA111 n=1 Tax=Ascobolus immersus RN42 TaxID=1160509 RepID=A0A3N4HLF3_ASCIM|nr:hypothetical protein BJ508DRAFT_215182 [Ascobolus immersus RN42]
MNTSKPGLPHNFQLYLPNQEETQSPGSQDDKKIRRPSLNRISSLLPPNAAQPPTPLLTPRPEGDEAKISQPKKSISSTINAPPTPFEAPGHNNHKIDLQPTKTRITEFPLPRQKTPPPKEKKPEVVLPEIQYNQPQTGAAASAALKDTWDRTLARCINGIVSIKATSTRNFDTEGAGNYTATGFVIDKKLGLILSNRHVVNPAPITAVAVFVNYEEVPIKPIYRDPIHDFGIFRYDPSKIRHIEVEEIELCPNVAKVGEDIKVVGNDSGEKLSILGSTLARLDREAPSYGINSYNDFNTFYMQAASGTSGGSSGSPVLNILGQAIALNAGGSNSSQSSFYLPLNRVVRAVEYVKRGEVVPRGTLQTEFMHHSYDELRRMGLSEGVEAECRARNGEAHGLLAVSRVLRGGPACPNRKSAPQEGVKGLEPGDIIYTCNGRYITDFVGLWEIIDDAVGQEIVLEVFRNGNKEALPVRLTVQDLHSITPSRFLEIGGAVVHDLSYQVGRNHNVQLGSGVICVASGFFFWSSWKRDFLITELDGKPTRTLDEFIEVVRNIPDGVRVPMMCRYVGKTENQHVMVDMDRHFFGAAIFTRDDKEGTWNKEELERPPPKKLEVETEEEEDVEVTADAEDEVEGMAGDELEHKAIENIRNSLVTITSRLPYSVFGYTSSSDFTSVGILVQKDPVPLVCFDRSSVPTDMLDIRLTVCNTQIPGRVVHLGDIALVTFPKEKMPAEATVPEWDDLPVKVHDKVKVVGLANDYVTVKENTISSIGMNINTWQCNPPRPRLINVEDINVLERISCWGGVIVRPTPTEEGKFKVSAYYMYVSSQDKSGENSHWRQGLDIKRYVLPHVERINREMAQGPIEPDRVDLGIEFADIPLAYAKTMGLSKARSDWYVKQARALRRVPRPLVVETKLVPSRPSDVDAALMPHIADIVLEINGSPISRISELQSLLDKSKESGEATMTVLRNKKELTLTLPLLPAIKTSPTPILLFFGAILHHTHAAALEQIAPNTSTSQIPVDGTGVYIGGVSYGSPSLDKLRPTQWVREIDGVKVNTLQDVERVVLERGHKWEEGEGDEGYVRVRMVGRKGVESLVSVRVHGVKRFWGVQWVEKNAEGGWDWRKIM